MRQIELTQNKVALVDGEDYEGLNQFKWHASWNGYKWYAERNISVLDGNGKILRMHRQILNAPKGVLVDHRNGNGLDNQKHNLRLCTNQQNQFNRNNCNKNNKLGIKGVRWREDIKKFQARIKLNSKEIHLGWFNVLGDADSAYRIAEDKHFGEFARKECAVQ